MKALTISQPFASLIASGEKLVENRTWGTPYRGPLAIHAGKGTQYLTREQMALRYPTGCVIAVAKLVACINIGGPRKWGRATELYPGLTIDDILQHKHTEGPWCWVLREVRKLDKFIPYRGAQGLWEVDFVSLEIAEL